MDRYRIIRRRIAWLLGNWVGEDLAASSRNKIYALLVHLVGRNASTDQAIRLTAARSLARCDTWDFDQAAFLPHLPAAIEEVVQLLGEVTEPDSMMRLNQTLGVIIARVEEHVSASSVSCDLHTLTVARKNYRRSRRIRSSSLSSWSRCGKPVKKAIPRLRSSSPLPGCAR